MLAKDFWYDLPQDRIAQAQAKPRDSSKLMVLEPGKQRIDHAYFYDLPDFLKPGDLLVVNDTKVFKARLTATHCHPERSESDERSRRIWIENKNNKPDPSTASDSARDDKKKFEIFLLRPDEKSWIALAKPGRKLAVGDALTFIEQVTAVVEAKNDDGTIGLRFKLPADKVFEFADRNGAVPVPPYVKEAPVDADDYQTVYAKQTGSAAAPTAGFHFTPELIEKIKKMGVGFASVTLHVGLGTFRPMQTENVEEHVMHEEWIDVPDQTVELIEKTRRDGGRVIAIGTTSVRALESEKRHGFTKVFIKPGFVFKNVDAMITNFHLPESTLLVLVSAFAQYEMDDPDAGRKFILDAYHRAIENNYRFYSFGDAMLIA